MNPTFDAILRSWPFDPWLVVGLIVVLLVYLRGWWVLQHRAPHLWNVSQPLCFVSGLLVIFLALASPIEPFASMLLQVHMVQHLLLMMFAPPLLWLGAPILPLIRGLPAPIRLHWAGPVLRWPLVHWASTSLTHPVTAWFLFVGTTWLWHLPPLYEFALASPGWHYAQHICFLGTGLLFWYPVVRPYPARPTWSLWLLAPYLLLADIQNTALSAVFCFSSTVLYPTYAEIPRLGNISALSDQAVAGVLMWVPGSLAYLIPLFLIGLRLLFGKTNKTPLRARLSLAMVPSRPPPRLDLLRWPVLGPFLRWRHARRVLQVVLFLLALVVIWDGLTGPPTGAMNLAGVLPWIHWRGLLVFGLLAAGNVFCMACPFTLPRSLAQRWQPALWPWPKFLRNKWLAIVLLALFLWAYEAFSLWDSPWLTAWMTLVYFLAAFVVDSLFRKASFCKYLCPIGQFNFLFSTVSPLEVKILDPAICSKCQTRDCIRGRDGIPGCELDLYLPRKQGNLDCTFCLDCVHACPHGNIGLVAVTPAADLWFTGSRSGLGQITRRLDLAVLASLFTFGAFANALGMVGPIVEAQQAFTNFFGLTSPFVAVTLFLGTTLVVVPLVFVSASAFLSQTSSGGDYGVRALAIRFSYALVPLGCAMWLVHYSFHFLTSYDTLIPTAQRFLLDQGWTSLGEPDWIMSCCRVIGDGILYWEIFCLNVGLLLALYTAYRISRGLIPSPGSIGRLLLPWIGMIVLLYALGIWIVFQPMQMRGLLGAA